MGGFGSRHWHVVQVWFHPPMALLQHAPPSQLQSALLFSSLQEKSSANLGSPQPISVTFSDLHLH